MNRVVLAIGLCPLLAGAAHAGPQPGAPFSVRESEPVHKPKLNFRLVQDPISDPAPVHNSGMVAQTEVAPNATVGVGLLKSSPKKYGSGDWRVENGMPRSRKAAVTLQLKF